MRKYVVYLITVIIVFSNLIIVGTCYSLNVPGLQVAAVPEASNVQIIEPKAGGYVDKGVVVGINNPPPEYLPINVQIQFNDDNKKLTHLLFYNYEKLQFTSNEKLTNYTWKIPFPGLFTYNQSVHAVVYYEDGTYDVSPTNDFVLRIAHVDKHLTIVSGKVVPDIDGAGSNPKLLEGFRIQNVITNSTGVYVFKTPWVSSKMSFWVTKNNYLAKKIKDVSVNTSNYSLTLPDTKMFAGDMTVDGKQDGVINLLDVMEVAKSFGSASGDEKYVEGRDLNLDGSVNLQDIMNIAKHFNAVADI